MRGSPSSRSQKGGPENPDAKTRGIAILSGTSGNERAELLWELAALDMEPRSRRGESPSPADYPHHAIDSLASIAQIEPFTARGKESMEKVVEFYSKLLQLRPNSNAYRKNLTLFSALLANSDSQRLVAISEPLSLENDVNGEELTVRALALYRDGKREAAAEHLQAVPAESNGLLTQLVTVLVLTDIDDERAVEQFEQVKQLIDKEQFPKWEIHMLVRESESRLAEMAERSNAS